jgi:site-specific recombinase XerD
MAARDQAGKSYTSLARNLMSALFSHAMRYEWTDKNPIKLVRHSAKRERVPDVLEPENFSFFSPSSTRANAH